jgi:hypothetical protein
MRLFFDLFLVLAILAMPAFTQEHTEKAQDTPVDTGSGTSVPPSPTGTQSNQSGQKNHKLTFPLDFLKDQKEMWTSPARLRFSDATWLVPLGGLTAGLLVTDTDVSRHLSRDPKTLSRYNTLSNAGVAALAGGAGAMLLLSYRNSNEHWRETGLLSGEAALQSLAMTQVLKYSFGRQRPDQGAGNGYFFQGGTSFPSEHSAAVWSVASVIAHEYPGPLPKFLAYGTATMVSYSRVHARDHFPSDVFIGALIGELAAHQVYSRHHDPEVSSAWETWSDQLRLSAEEPSSANLGSPHVPLDSWVYPAFDRLTGLGVIDGGFVGMRPWTRRECARLVSAAADRINEVNEEAGKIYRELEIEFRPELEHTSGSPQGTLESVYARVLNISGTPLTNGFYFGQTHINNFGRPYAEGWSTTTGLSFYATAGPWFGYFRGELQTAPSIPPLPLGARQFIGTIDSLPGSPLSTTTAAIQQFQFLDAYVGLTLLNWEVSFGNQSLSWGPGAGGALMLSENAPPIPMFRINRATPWAIPLVSRFLGPMRAEFFFGQLAGHHFVGKADGSTVGSFEETLHPQPFIHGQRFSFKPTANFEFGFSHTTVMGGPGVPLTWGTFKHSLFGLGNAPPGTPNDPGDRRSGMDWIYRLPKLRNWLIFYGDAFTDDEFSPIAYWDRSAFRAGLFLSHFPSLPKLDVRVEGVYTDLPVGGPIGHGFFYANTRFRNGYTNDGSLIGSWIGRDGQGAQAWINYWLGAKNRVELSFRHQKISQQFDPGGGTLTDFGIRSDLWVRPRWQISTATQYESWTFPVLKSGTQKNFSTSIEVAFRPNLRVFHSRDK